MNKKIVTLLIILLVALLGFAIFKKFNPTPKTTEGQLSEKEIKSLVTKVSKLINVPGETPVIATIIKADQLIAEQKFYTGSKDGDYLMVFPIAQKAIIYRESENKLINVGPIIVDQKATTTKSETIETKATTTEKATSTKGGKTQ
ncbi:hypothetical protein H7Y21_03005 [Arenimonas sp.]|nr:hypothetical protein [Candidatus Parcubacteria bacterium]